jgi:hypothetical protein
MALALALGPAALAAQEMLTPDRFESLQRLIHPQDDESRWAAVPWLTNLSDARERSSREDKPLFLWRSGGGDVLGRT